MSREKLNVAIVGLGFGKEFIPIYQNHPLTNMYAICQRTKDKLNEVGDQYKVSKRYESFEELIEDPNVGAVHINSPIHLHAPQSTTALKAGKHVACTVPAATTVDDCRAIVNAAAAAGKNYMMMETAIIPASFCLFVSYGTAAGWDAFSSCAGPTSRRWQVGQVTGKAFPRCTMLHTL